jgi:hypothetical protein
MVSGTYVSFGALKHRWVLTEDDGNEDLKFHVYKVLQRMSHPSIGKGLIKLLARQNWSLPELGPYENKCKVFLILA